MGEDVAEEVMEEGAVEMWMVIGREEDREGASAVVVVAVVMTVSSESEDVEVGMADASIESCASPFLFLEGTVTGSPWRRTTP